MLSREQVVWAYRAMLGREPEAEAVVEALRHLPDFESLRQRFLKTEEFALTNKVTWLRGYWVAAPVINGKYLMWLDLGDRYMSFGCLLDNYEPTETAFMRAVLKPGDVVVDAGANLGWFTLVASAVIGEAGRVHAFEPRPETADYLEKTVALNHLGGRVTVHRCGLADMAGSGVLAWSEETDNPGGSFLVKGAPPNGMRAEPIPLHSLDELALSRLDFLKMDIEGAEMQVLQGAHETLQRCRPVMLSELNPPMLRHVSGAAAEDYFALLDRLGYRCFILDQERCGDEVRGFPNDWYKPLINLALLPRGDNFERLAAVLAGLSATRSEEAPPSNGHAAKGVLPGDSQVYKLTHFSQPRLETAAGGAPAAASGRHRRATRGWSNWRRAGGALLGAARARFEDRASLDPEDVATALYRGMLGRDPDPVGLSDKARLLRSGAVLEEVIRTVLGSAEFRLRMLQATVPEFQLPDLTQIMPDRYRRETFGDTAVTIYSAREDADIDRMVQLIGRHRYYDAPGVWAPVIDLDKEVTAAIVRGLGARSCFELGCYTGPVLSLLAEAGISVAGAEVSHTAFAFAYPNVRDSMLFGDLLSLDINRRFDAVVCMDVLEHLSPLHLGRYIERLKALLTDDGFIYLNSPMYGTDPIFGTVFGAYVPEWLSVGDRAFWREWPCDDRGWPQHGHLVWAEAGWWTRLFAAHGLLRDLELEGVIQRRLSGFFRSTPARQSLFVLRHPGAARSPAIAAELDATLAGLPNLPPPAA